MFHGLSDYLLVSILGLLFSSGYFLTTKVAKKKTQRAQRKKMELVKKGGNKKIL